MIQDRLQISLKSYLYGMLFIIGTSFIIYHTLHWSVIILIIFVEFFITLLIIESFLRLREFYQIWRERRRQNRPQRVLIRLERNLNNHVIIHLKEECIICLEELVGAIQLKCGPFSFIYHF